MPIYSMQNICLFQPSQDSSGVGAVTLDTVQSVYSNIVTLTYSHTRYVITQVGCPR
jgi:hypothetical protein